MKHYFAIVLLWVVALVPALAQAPRGWMLRADRSTSAADPDKPGPISFTALGSGFHAVTPQAAVFWNPANAVTGNNNAYVTGAKSTIDRVFEQSQRAAFVEFLAIHVYSSSSAIKPVPYFLTSS